MFSATLRFVRRLTPFFLLGSLIAGASRGQEAGFIAAASPKSEELEKPHPRTAPERHPPRFVLDRESITIGLIQGGAELYDGFTTEHFVHSCRTCTERDPASRFLLGARPRWTNMLAYGSIEAVAGAYLNQTLRRSSSAFIRRMATVIPIGISAIHIVEGSNNFLIVPSPHLQQGRALLAGAK